MTVFAYEALATDGKRIRGVLSADTAAAAREQLRSRDLAVASMNEAAEAASSTGGWRAALAGLGRGRRYEEITAMTGHLAVLLRVGVRMVEALDTLAMAHKPLEKVLRSLAEKVTGGDSFSEALGGYPRLFDEVYIAVARVGEASGTLDVVLERISTFRAAGQQARGKVASALIYPAMLLAVGIGVVFFLTGYVLPKVISVLVASGRPLPAVTSALMAFSGFVQAWWWAMLIALAATAALLRWTVSRPAGRYAWHRLLMRLPVLGDLCRKSVVARFASLLQTLLASGLRLPESLAVLQRTADNAVLEAEIDRIRTGLTEGSRLTELMTDSRCFDAVAVRMLGIGEASGELEALLTDLSASYERDVDQATGRFLALLEPSLILVLAAVVGVILFAVLLPILEASNIAT